MSFQFLKIYFKGKKNQLKKIKVEVMSYNIISFNLKYNVTS